MVAVVAHEMHTWQVELPIALRAPGNMKYPCMLSVLELFDLLELRLGLRTVRRYKLFVL